MGDPFDISCFGLRQPLHHHDMLEARTAAAAAAAAATASVELAM
jgi:hypothetical protein